MSNSAVLIVEDTPQFQDIYRRAVERQQGVPVVVDTLEKAISAIQQRVFSVAIVDIRLDEKDDKNEDGLRVLQFLRKVGDGTNSIVITGHGSMKIGWEAQVNSAFAAFSKADATLTAIEKKILEGQRGFKQLTPKRKAQYSEMLRPRSNDSWQWEGRMLRICSPKGGADGLYRFLSEFLRELNPLLQYRDPQGCQIFEDRGLVVGVFWSRQLGKPILIAFGPQTQAVQESIKNIDETGLPLGTGTKLGPEINDVSSSGIQGVARILEHAGFSSFEQP